MLSGVRTIRKPTINTTLDPDVSMLIAGSTVTGVEESGVWLSSPKSLTTSDMTSRNTDPHVDIEVTVIIPPDGPGDRRPGLADAENTLNVIALEDIS